MEMKTLYEPAVFTTKKRRTIIIAQAGSNRRFILNQRCILKSPKDYNAGILALLLRDYFPCMKFIPKNSSDNLSILNYIIKKNGKWTLDIGAMSKSKEKSFSCLFPENISLWDETKARKKYGRADVIRFFIDAENDRFLFEFSGLKNAALAKIDGNVIIDEFFEKLKDYDGKPVWEEWDFSNLVLHAMRHNPPSIYEAFDYYGHRNYTLAGFGLRKICEGEQRVDGNYSEAELLQSGNKLLNETLPEHIPGMANFSIDRLTDLFELVQETLESVPTGKTIYAPTEFDVFIKQLKSRIPNLYKKHPDGDTGETYTSTERKTINNHMEKMRRYVEDGENLPELRKLGLNGTYREKVNLLHRLIMDPLIRKQYAPRELDTIHGLFLKQRRSVSLDNLLNGDGDEGVFIGHDIIGDEKYLRPDNRFAWAVFFRNEFEQEFDEPKLEKFLECLPDHFAQYPFEVDSDGNLKMSKYSKKMLFSTFCSVAGIAEDSELWKLFLVLIQRVIGNINKGADVSRGADYGNKQRN
jgi:hypothetical protein